MSDEELTPEELAQLEAEDAKGGGVGDLLKRSLAKVDDELPEPAKDDLLLKNVQSKLRKRSKGKFYGDGWSTSQSKISYVLVAGVMLMTIVAVYLALGPTGQASLLVHVEIAWAVIAEAGGGGGQQQVTAFGWHRRSPRGLAPPLPLFLPRGRRRSRQAFWPWASPDIPPIDSRCA